MEVFGPRQEQVLAGRTNVVKIWYPHGYRLGQHSHPRPIFCYAIKGGYREHTAAGVIDAGPASLTYLPSGEAHRDSVAPGGLYALRVEVDGSWAGEIPGLTDVGPKLVVGKAEWYARAMAEELRRAGPLAELVLESLTALVLSEVVRRPPPKEAGVPPWLLQVRDRIRDEFPHPPTLQELAADVGRHPSHVARAFRDHLAQSVGEYTREHRLAVAKDLIAHTARPLSMVALDCGFSDQSHMGRAFKRRFGLAPGAFRKEVRR